MKETLWLGVGFLGQAMFSMRFLVQWVHSERQRRSIIPIAFWYFSILGGMTLFAYALYREDPVFILGQGAGLVIYARNLYFIRRERALAADNPAGDGA
jgi:lipid-A-disaccharide synthase-like uncharacterized protein